VKWKASYSVSKNQPIDRKDIEEREVDSEELHEQDIDQAYVRVKEKVEPNSPNQCRRGQP